MKNWRTGTPTESGDYYVVVRYGSRAGFHGIYSETPAVFSTNFGGIWGNMNIPSNDFDEIVKWMPLEEAREDICLKCKHGYRASDINPLEVYCEARIKRDDPCVFEADSEAEEKEI